MQLPLSLPAPGPDALAASAALQDIILAEIKAQHGWISFAKYMELALYAPRLGYYSGGAVKLGKDGDFTTAPEMTPLFGAALARAIAPLLAQTTAQIMEFGAGSGRLAYDVLSECQALGVQVERYFIVDLSGELRARQEELLSGFPQVQWLQQMPAAFSGVVLGNEVLDAMPVHLVTKAEEGWRECGVVAALTDGREHLAYHTRACDRVLLEQIPARDTLPVGYTTEVHAPAAGFMRSLAAMLQAGRKEGRGGAAILLDYGFPAREYYLEQRSQGTLMCHYRHHAHPDPFYLPGLQDITAHVDFSTMAGAAVQAGLDVLAYTSQAAFLLQAGIGELLLRTPPEHAMRYLPQANAVQKLLSPAEMGELFKVLIVGCGVELDVNLLRHDRRHRL